jgi:hypothetical protein
LRKEVAAVTAVPVWPQGDVISLRDGRHYVY